MTRANDAQALRFYAAVGIGVAAVSTGVVLNGRSRGGAGGDLGDRGAIAEFCAEGLTPIPGGCFAMPARAARPAPLVVYLHGRYADDTAKDERARQARVARMATARGFAVLAVRGKRGQCTDPTLADWWCWPSNEKNQDDGPAFAASIAPAVAVAEARAGKGRRYLLGFSNGGYFAALIATRALMAFDAVAIAHAGPVEPTLARGAKMPVLLVTADDDPSNDEVLRLDAELARAGWPHAIVARDGGHELPEWDVEMALTFFGRTAKEPMPLSPPLSTRAPRRTPPDAGTEVALSTATATSTATPTPTATPTSTATPTASESAAASEAAPAVSEDPP